MARGRAPCCDKNNVKRGPWSPAEDLKLITFIQKHGHDNWRSLPTQAGLRRCGKSCRLRWVNYLSPDLKRGNFSQEEEDTVIGLHQAIGNKWSKIAAHLPGRTDNEIKNVWNTHLKKRLTCKAVEDATKETSVITSSSSSSATAESKFKCHKSNTESQMKTASPETTVVNQVTKVHSEPSNNGNKQLEQCTIWDDLSLLESVLNEEDDHNWPALENTQNESTGKDYSCVLLTESDFDFWSMLDEDVMPASAAKDDHKEADNAHSVEAPMTKRSNGSYEYTEAGLVQQSMNIFEMQKQDHKNDITNSFSAVATCSEVPEIDNMNGYPMWPQSPINFYEE